MKIGIHTGESKKGRTFQAELMAWIDAPAFFEGGNADTKNNRPVWVVLASSEQETRAFIANFRNGKVAEKMTGGYSRSTDRWQLLKTSGHHMVQRKAGGGVVTTLFLPELFYINPGMVDPDGIRFIMLPDPVWLAKQSDTDTAEAMLFMAYIDRRTRFPFPPEPRFAKSLLARCLEIGLASKGQSHYSYGDQRRFTYIEHGLSDLGLPGGIAFRSTHDEFGHVLAAEIRRWQEATHG